MPEINSKELGAQLFDDLDGDVAARAVKKYHNKHLRLNARDSATLKMFAGMNDNHYIKFSRSYFSITGLRILVPIKKICDL